MGPLTLLDFQKYKVHKIKDRVMNTIDKNVRIYFSIGKFTIIYFLTVSSSLFSQNIRINFLLKSRSSLGLVFSIFLIPEFESHDSDKTIPI